MAQAGSSGISVTKTLHHRDAFVRSMAYTALERPVLSEILELGAEAEGRAAGRQSRTVVRVSKDNGRTWQFTGEGEWQEQRGDRVARRCAPVYFLDHERRAMVRFATEFECGVRGDYADGFGPGADGTPLQARTARIYYAISTDGGTTWGKEKQLVQDGPGYDPVHWAKGIYYGRNSAFFDELLCAVQLRNGDIIVPVGFNLLDDKEERLILRGDRFGTVVWPVEACACFVGRWRADLSDIAWEMSNPVTVPEYLSRSLCEPAVVEMDAGTLMMLMRGESGPLQTMTGVKFFAVSKDGGRTWGPGVPLTYPDASFVNSPGSLPNLFRSAKNGRVYLIANICPGPVRHADPRYPLKIAEVDPKYLWVLPQTETAIEDRQARHGTLVRFSNWQRIEDRETRNPVLFMGESRADAIVPDPEEKPVIPDAYRYEIDLPEA
jgi:hypothetical protein